MLQRFAAVNCQLAKHNSKVGDSERSCKRARHACLFEYNNVSHAPPAWLYPPYLARTKEVFALRHVVSLATTRFEQLRQELAEVKRKLEIAASQEKHSRIVLNNVKREAEAQRSALLARDKVSRPASR